MPDRELFCLNIEAQHTSHARNLFKRAVFIISSHQDLDLKLKISFHDPLHSTTFHFTELRHPDTLPPLLIVDYLFHAKQAESLNLGLLSHEPSNLKYLRGLFSATQTYERGATIVVSFKTKKSRVNCSKTKHSRYNIN